MEKLRKEGVKVGTKIKESKYGKFAWASDPEGNWMELWEPPRKYTSPEKEIQME